MHCQLTIFFGSPAVRQQFMRDVDGLILHHDYECREDQDRMNYEDTLSFSAPDLNEKVDDLQINAWPRKSFAATLKAINSSASACS